jgi:2-phospho-L-lactate guanylyltransferase
MKPLPDARNAWALLPVKSPNAAKSRLSALFSPEERAELQRAMLRDVLKALSGARSLAGIAVISSDPGIGAIACAYGASFIAEIPPAGDLNRALILGTRRLAASGARIIAVIPADVPLIEAGDIERAVAAAERSNAVIVVPDRHREGTNALVFQADRLPDFEFGAGSFRRHLAAQGDRPALALALKSLALDIDVADDIEKLKTHRGRTAAAETKAMVASAAAFRRNPVCEDV